MEHPSDPAGSHPRKSGRPRRHRLGLTILTLVVSAGSPSCADQELPTDDCRHPAIIGNRLPEQWRPFSDESPWNTPIPANPTLHPDSDRIIATMAGEAPSLRLSNAYMPPLWVVDTRDLSPTTARCSYPFDTWDQDWDGVTDVGVPIGPGMYGEGTSDGHIIVVDPLLNLSWEMSKFTGITDGFIACSTFNIWDLEGRGVGDPDEGRRWQARGGRGSGFPIIAGLIRPAELAAGSIHHALVFMFPANRTGVFLPPATRSDGSAEGSQYPVEGMLLQLDPSLTDADFDGWGLTRKGRIVARALQTYGMYDGDNGGAMSLQIQLLGETEEANRLWWEQAFPGFYDTITRIPTSAFHVVYTGEPVSGGGAMSTVVQPLILPLGGRVEDGSSVTISTPTAGAHVTYTLDGSDPTRTSTLYAGPFSIEGPVTIRARAFKSGMKQSPVTRAPFGVSAAPGTGPEGRPEPPILCDP